MNYTINTQVTFDKRTNPEAFEKACKMHEALDKEVDKQPKNYYGLNVNKFRYEKAACVLGYEYTNRKTDGCLVIKVDSVKKLYFRVI